ncbi:probable bifunctional dTTP/UTP pyrophosphatase/methyltransferase protein isoform X2 [Saccopteryx bilineata]|uniref:probable bifunctional dTTP/UTP pyrophosphatase/methyltransferase protein isoform X2 n=1 Tax=Saccopteryx bilineata TaxID=59482 RepID=UPI00338DE5D9
MYPVIRKLQRKRVVLASASPRRQEILSNAGLRFEVVPSRFKEKLDKASFPTPYAYAVETAKQKALEVASRMHQKDLRAPDIVIGADTIVTIGGLILEKPLDKQDAYTMLSRLNGKEHSVFTGVTIIRCCSTDGRLSMEVTDFYEETLVKFSPLSEELLWEYIDSGEPMDKAGGYGIQALGGMLVEYVRGDFLNVVGFPLNHFCKTLAQLYCPPRVRQDSVPDVDTFEHLSALEGGGSNLAQGGAQAGDADQNRTLEDPPLADLLRLIDGFQSSKALFVACEMKVFDLLKAEAPLSAVEVARKTEASERGTEWLLDVCAALGLLRKAEGGYSNTELADRYLLSKGEDSLHGLIMHHHRHTWHLYTHLEAPLRDGSMQSHWPAGHAGEDLCQDSLSRNQDSQLQFMRAVHSLSKVTARRVATAFDLSRFSSACDLGGCTGALAHVLAREYPGLTVTVMDLPEIIKDVMGFQPDGPQTDRVSFVPGDFFKDRLPEADLYILSRILQDWQEHKVHELLSRISARCKPGGGVLVVGPAPDRGRCAALPGLLTSPGTPLQDGGRERSPDEYRSLLQAHGFTEVRAVPAGSVLHVILATRAASMPGTETTSPEATG